MNHLKKAAQITSLAEIGKACGVTYQAVQKWIKNGKLPRTEWTGETKYAKIIERLTNKQVTAKQLTTKNT